MKHVFFKSVRKDGSSVWAIDKFTKIYKVGETYTFPESHPGHVFTCVKNRLNGFYQKLFCISNHDNLENYDLSDIPFHDTQFIYDNRAENITSTRVLICYGELFSKRIKIHFVDVDWDNNDEGTKYLVNRLVSTNFTIIGEIVPKRKYVPQEDYGRYDVKLINY